MPRDFLDLAARATVDRGLSRLAKAGHLRRLARKLYDLPKLHPKLGALTPAPYDVAQALKREIGSRLQIDGVRAANALGLSTELASQSSGLTVGPSRRVVLGTGCDLLTDLPVVPLSRWKRMHLRRIGADQAGIDCKVTALTNPSAIDDRFILDAEHAHIDTPALDLVARSYGSDYVRSRDSFQFARPSWADRPKDS